MMGNKARLNPSLVNQFPEAYISMGHTAERVAKRFEISRETQDAFALRSHEKALAAIKAGRVKQDGAVVSDKGHVVVTKSAVEPVPTPITASGESSGSM
jgi:acetyl-CoA acyltransferase